MIRIHPLVNVRTAGVSFWFGPAEFWFSVVHGSTHSPPPAGAVVATPLKVGPAPHPQRGGERDLAFPPRPRGYRTHVDTSSVPAPSLRASAHSAARCPRGPCADRLTELGPAPPSPQHRPHAQQLSQRAHGRYKWDACPGARPGSEDPQGRQGVQLKMAGGPALQKTQEPAD